MSNLTSDRPGYHELQISTELTQRIRDLRGETFGRLTVLNFLGTFQTYDGQGRRVNNRTLWLCRCDCGGGQRKYVEVSSRHLLGKGTQSCGCLRIDRLREETSPLSQADVDQIHRRIADGDELSAIATDYNVTLACISAIGLGKRRAE